MNKFWRIAGVLSIVLLLLSPAADAADYQVEVLNEAPPADELSDEVSALLAKTGVRVLRGAGTKYCDIWLCREWPVVPDFQPSPTVLYPFSPGQLLGVVRFARKGSDFRDQDISRGVYTLRYGLQPVDGAHVGTSPTRDFLLLLKADSDQSAAAPSVRDLNRLSAAAAESSHPLMLAMQRVGEASGYPGIRHQTEADWWILQVEGAAKTDAVTPLPLEFVVFGRAAE